MFSIPDGSFKSFENYIVKLLAEETEWFSFGVRTHLTFLETLISKYDIGPVKLPADMFNNLKQAYLDCGRKLRLQISTVPNYCRQPSGVPEIADDGILEIKDFRRFLNGNKNFGEYFKEFGTLKGNF